MFKNVVTLLSQILDELRLTRTLLEKQMTGVDALAHLAQNDDSNPLSTFPFLYELKETGISNISDLPRTAIGLKRLGFDWNQIAIIEIWRRKHENND